MDQIGKNEIELKVHGLTSEEHGRVPARVFANKLKQLVAALEAADLLKNGKAIHTYVLASMHMSEPTAVLAEVPLDEDAARGGSAIPVFGEAIETIKVQGHRLDWFIPVVKKVTLLTSGVEHKFSFAEIRTSGSEVVRIDDFLRGRANAAKRTVVEPWFSGTVHGSFDGKLEYVDTRGALPQIKLTLSAGGKEIDCVCRREDIDILGDALKGRRVRIYGRAIYVGSSALPIRVEANSVELIAQPGDFSRWKSSFRPFDIEPWDAEA